ncbi:hypothetical protein HHX47_DHR9000300, partial [Lentinula edodes]
FATRRPLALSVTIGFPLGSTTLPETTISRTGNCCCEHKRNKGECKYQVRRGNCKVAAVCCFARLVEIHIERYSLSLDY